MYNVIDTPNLGPVTISRIAIKHYSAIRQYQDLIKAEEELVRIVQSKEMDQLKIPVIVANQVSAIGGDPEAIEFWCHMGSSMIFTVLPREDYKVISLGIKQSVIGIESCGD